MRDTDLRREATAVIAQAASALLYNTAMRYLVWVCGRVFRGGMSDAMGKKTGVKLFRLNFSTDRSSRKSQFFDWIPQAEDSVEKR